MLIAREKKKNNIAEYILYMWQLEDMLRALKLDMEQVEFVTLPNKSAGNGHLLPVGEEIVELINNGFNPYDEEIKLADLDLVTSYGSSGSSSSSGSSGSSGNSTSTSKPSTKPSTAPVESEEPSVEPLETETPAVSASTAPSSSPAASSSPETTPASTPAPAATPAPVQTPAPVSTPAPTEDIEYGPGMEPVA